MLLLIWTTRMRSQSERTRKRRQEGNLMLVIGHVQEKSHWIYPMWAQQISKFESGLRGTDMHIRYSG